MPVVSGCITWVVYRIFIRGVMYADEEEKFNRTLGWCGLVYPYRPLRHPHHFHPQILHLQHLLPYENIPRLHDNHRLLALLLRPLQNIHPAWSSDALSSCIRRSTPCTWNDRKVEQGTGKHVAGSHSDYYLPKISGANSASITTTASGGVKQHQPSIKDNYSSVEPAISPAVIAGKLAINAKRAEELFFPILNLIFVRLFFIFRFWFR